MEALLFQLPRVGAQVVRRRLDVPVARLEGAERESAVRDHLRPRLAREARGAPEVVGVRVGDHDGVDVGRLQAGPGEPLAQRLPGAGSGQAGIDHGRSAVVEQRVAVDVPESREPNRELHPQHAGSQLAHLVAGALLFLADGHAGHATPPSPPRAAEPPAGRAGGLSRAGG